MSQTIFNKDNLETSRSATSQLAERDIGKFDGNLVTDSFFFIITVGGGGEWGAKASLLSLDPKTSHTLQSEADELDKFMRSFNGEEDAKDAIAQPGDFVQFFVERDARQMDPNNRHHLKAMHEYPPVRFGCGDMHMRDIDLPDRLIAHRKFDRGHTEQLYFDHFGAHSAEGIYVSYDRKGTSTKLDVPGASVTSTRAKGTEGAYRHFVRLPRSENRTSAESK